MLAVSYSSFQVVDFTSVTTTSISVILKCEIIKCKRGRILLLDKTDGEGASGTLYTVAGGILKWVARDKERASTSLLQRKRVDLFLPAVPPVPDGLINISSPSARHLHLRFLVGTLKFHPHQEGYDKGQCLRQMTKHKGFRPARPFFRILAFIVTFSFIDKERKEPFESFPKTQFSHKTFH